METLQSPSLAADHSTDSHSSVGNKIPSPRRQGVVRSGSNNSNNTNTSTNSNNNKDGKNGRSSNNYSLALPPLRHATFEIELQETTPTPTNNNNLSSPSSQQQRRYQQQYRHDAHGYTILLSNYVQAACHHIQKQWVVLVAGQVLSFLVACAGAAQATLSFDCNLSAPTFSLLLFYTCLSLCLIPICRESCIQKETQQIRYDLEKQYETVATNMQQQKASSTSTKPSSPQNHQSPVNHNGNGLPQSPLSPQHASINQNQLHHREPTSPSSLQGSGKPFSITISSPTSGSISNTTTSIPQPPNTFLFGLIHLSSPAYVYFFMALLDVYANYFTVLAFSYTTITSVTLLDALAIPSAMILSRLFLKREYSRIHLIGACLCMVGVVLNVFQDYEDEINENKKQQAQAQNDVGGDAAAASSEKEFPHRVKGDLIAVAGGVLFGASSVVGEVAVRDLGGPNEYVGMLGFFAACICFIQTLLIERDDLAEFFGQDEENWTNPNISSSTTKCKQSTARMILFTFVIINFVNYIGRAWFLQVSEAAFLNLSLLTGDMWSVLFSVIAEKIAPHAFFYVALMITLSGVLVYEMAPSPIHDDEPVEIAIAQNDDDDDDHDDSLNNDDNDDDNNRSKIPPIR